MLKRIKLLKYPNIDKIVFAFSAVVCAFWYLGQHMNVYRFAVVGGIFEFLSLPMLALLIVLPVISILLMVKEKFSLKSFSVYSFLLLLVTYLLLNFLN